MSQILAAHLSPDALETFLRASRECEARIEVARSYCDDFLARNGIDPSKLCLVVVGSVGRDEALEASDFDLVPVFGDAIALGSYLSLDKPFREGLASALGHKVSEGSKLTKATDLGELTHPESIGGEADCSAALTKRILIATEGRRVGGELGIAEVRRAVLAAYQENARTSGRHVLSFCNDLARYYRTLCIEYKAKAHRPEDKWSVRNAKLRHSRKFWFFSCIIAITNLAEFNPEGYEGERYVSDLLDSLGRPPVERLLSAVGGECLVHAARAADSYAWFLRFMGQESNRLALETVEHAHRKNTEPFPAVKANSDRLHDHILLAIASLPEGQRRHVLSWFLL